MWSASGLGIPAKIRRKMRIRYSDMSVVFDRSVCTLCVVIWKVSKVKFNFWDTLYRRFTGQWASGFIFLRSRARRLELCCTTIERNWQIPQQLAWQADIAKSCNRCPYCRAFLEMIEGAQLVQKLTHILWNLKVHYHAAKIPLLDPILSHMNTVHIGFT